LLPMPLGSTAIQHGEYKHAAYYATRRGMRHGAAAAKARGVEKAARRRRGGRQKKAEKRESREEKRSNVTRTALYLSATNAGEIVRSRA